MSVRPAKTQISLGIRPVWSESSLSAWRKLGSWATHKAHSEDSDQTGRMPRLIWVFAGRTLIFWFCHVAAHFVQRYFRIDDIMQTCLILYVLFDIKLHCICLFPNQISNSYVIFYEYIYQSKY